MQGHGAAAPLRSEAPQPFQYQGSKRGLARHIVGFLPAGSPPLIEPFAGSAAVTLAAAWYGKAGGFHVNDSNEPLVRLWRAIIDDPQGLAEAYARLWGSQLPHPRAHYASVRDRFNREPDPAALLYLLARAVKGAVRYNARGQFNQSPDNRRRGTRPETVRRRLEQVSRLLQGRVVLTSTDYREVLRRVPDDGVVYMDPPYEGVSGGRDSRYASGLQRSAFELELRRLVAADVAFILSYDGRTGAKTYGAPLDGKLGLTRLEIEVGRSSSATLHGRDDRTTEALYLSPALLRRLGSTGVPAADAGRQQRARAVGSAVRS